MSVLDMTDRAFKFIMFQEEMIHNVYQPRQTRQIPVQYFSFHLIDPMLLNASDGATKQ